MTDAAFTNKPRFSAWVRLAGGCLATAALACGLTAVLPAGSSSRVLVAAAVLAGMVLSCLAYWRASRSDAGTGWRAELVGIVAFASVAPIAGRSTSDLMIHGSWMHSIADFMQTIIAVGLGMVITKWLYGVDKREAAKRAATTSA